MKQFFKYLLASVIGFILASAIIVFVFVGVVTAIASSAGSEKEVIISDNSVLHLKLNEPITDRASKNPFENFDFISFSTQKKLGLNEILENIDKAKSDENIKGIYLDLTSIPSGMVMIEEIRNKLIEFKSAEKFIVSYSEYYSQASYYLASVADDIYLNPQGAVDFKGIGGEILFFKGALEKLGIEPQIIRHGKFKSAVEPFMLDKMSDENRKQTETYLNSIWGHILSGVSRARDLSFVELDSIADNLLLETAEDAVRLKMVDKLTYRDEVLEILKEKTKSEASDKIKFVSIDKYSKVRKGPSNLLKEKIAVIYAIGQIESGEGDDETIGSERISKAIRDARQDDKIKAIVLRVNSPGGSAMASEVIWREVSLAKQTKPVIVSMGNVAASGGYYIACAADTIVASPNTITGSIGVFGVLFNNQKLLNGTLGITIDTVKTNRHSDIGSVFRPLTATERDFIQRSVEHVYDVFITRVADGRKISKANVDSIGQGRVWSGVDAKRIGLVDVLGGLETAIEIAANKAGLKEYRLVSYPKQKEAFEAIVSQVTGDAEVSLLRNELGENYRYYKSLKELTRNSGILTRMPFEIDIH